MEGFEQILTLVGSTSPVVALLAWHIWNQHKQFDKFAEAQDRASERFAGALEKVTAALHDLDKRLAVIEQEVENRKVAA